MYLVRERVFDYDNNKYYVPKGEFNTWKANVDLAMPNCTMYSFLRMQEATEQEEKQDTWIREDGGFGHAKTWYNTTTLPKGSIPKVGSIAVFNGTCGHVAFVEKVIDNTHVVITESNYDANKNLRNYKFWRTRTVNLVVGKATLSGIGKLIGYIYLPINDARVDRDETKDQVEVLENLVNVRKNPSLSAAVFEKGLYCPEGIFNVLEWKEADGYTWAKLCKNCWIACGSWTNIYKKDDKAELKARLTELQSKKSELEAELKSVNAEIKDIKSKL